MEKKKEMKEENETIIKNELKEEKQGETHHINVITRQIQIQKPDIQVSISSEDPNENIEMLLDMSLFVIDELGSKKNEG